MFDEPNRQDIKEQLADCIEAIRSVLTADEFGGFVKGLLMLFAWLGESEDIIRGVWGDINPKA